MRGLFGVISVVVLLTSAAAACSSSPADTKSAPAQPATDESGTALPSSEAPEEVDAGWQPTVTDATCAKKKTTASCQACCEEAHPDGAQVLFDSQRACACRKPEPSCLAECGATFCEGPPPPLSFYEDNQPCFGCFTYATDPGGPDEDCLDTMRAACDADPACAKMFGCFAKCP